MKKPEPEKPKAEAVLWKPSSVSAVKKGRVHAVGNRISQAACDKTSFLS